LGDGKHFAGDQSLPVTQIEHLAKELGNLVTEGADEIGDGGEVRGAVAGEGNEGDVLPAGPFNLARTDDATAVGEEHNLEQHRRRVGGSAGEVVLVSCIKSAEVNFVINQPAQRMFEGAGEHLSLEINGEKPRAGVDGFVAGNKLFLSGDKSLTIDIPFGSPQNAPMKILFIQPRWASEDAA